VAQRALQRLEQLISDTLEQLAEENAQLRAENAELRRRQEEATPAAITAAKRH
jgi:regulator of replication initiation timing